MFKWNFPDNDECAEETHDCHKHAFCNDTDGSFNCTCETGYSGDGKSCHGQFAIFPYSTCIHMLTLPFYEYCR